MTNSKVRRAVIWSIAAIVIVACGAMVTRNMLASSWASMVVNTPAMADTRTYLGKLKGYSLTNSVLKEKGGKLHNAIFYPDVRTVVVSVAPPMSFSTPVFAYLVMDDGTYIAGWYQDNLVKHGVYKIAFEELESDRVASLDVLDGSIVTGGYDPTQEYAGRIRFPLTPPDLENPKKKPIGWANPAPSSSSSVSASSNGS